MRPQTTGELMGVVIQNVTEAGYTRKIDILNQARLPNGRAFFTPELKYYGRALDKRRNAEREYSVLAPDIHAAPFKRVAE